jgi:hypothetical protein
MTRGDFDHMNQFIAQDFDGPHAFTVERIAVVTTKCVALRGKTCNRVARNHPITSSQATIQAPLKISHDASSSLARRPRYAVGMNRPAPILLRPDPLAPDSPLYATGLTGATKTAESLLQR